MITTLLWFAVALVALLGLVIISEALEVDRFDLAGLGAAIVGVSLLVAYAAYRYYYRPPRGHGE